LSNEATTNFSGLLTEDFALYAQLLPGSANANSNFDNGGTVLYEITRVSGALDILALSTTVSASVAGASNYGLTNDATTRASESSNLIVKSNGEGSASYSEFVSVWAGSTSATLSARMASGLSPLFLRATTASPGITSVSPNAVIDVKIFIDELGGANGQYDVGEWFTTQRVTLYASSRLSPTLTVGSPAKGDLVVTASATLNTLNWSNLDGKPFLAVSTSDTTAVFTKTGSTGTTVTSSAQTGAVITARAGVISESFVTNALTESTTVGIQLRYASNGTATNIESGVLLGATGFTSALVSAPGVDNISVSSVANANVTGGGVSYTVRPNQTYTVKVFASTNSVSVSKAVTVTLDGTGLVTSSKLLSINGGSFLTAYPAAGFTVTTGTDGYGSFTFATSGFVDGDHVTVSASVGNTGATDVRFEADAPVYTVVIDDTLVATSPGTAVNVTATVEDQWDELSAMTNQSLKVSRAIVSGAFNFAPTISYHAVTAGAATFAFTPQGASATGSVTLTVDVVKSENGAYIDNGTEDTITVTVTGNANDFSTGLAPTHAATVSYFPSTVSWTTITGKVDVTGSAVTITGDNVVFRKSAAVPATTAGTITVASDANAEYSFQVAPRTTGDKTLTLTNGSATTTSELIVSDAYSDYGYAITWDTTTIVAGKTRIVTGTLTDENGNPVDTTNRGSATGDSGTASIVVTYTGTAGIVVGTMPTETDADGKFRLSVLTSAADQGDLTFTAVYMPQGSATVASKKLTSVQVVTVGEASASADQKVNAGSFKGYVAVYAKGYEGQRLSAKVGNDWVVVPALASNFVRVVEFTGAGYTIAVRIYIDRVLVDTITVTTK